MRQLQFAVCLFTSALLAAAQRFTVTIIPMPSNPIDIFANGINQMGVVLEVWISARRGVPYLDPPQVICSLVNGQPRDAFGINDFRQIAGNSDRHGVIYSNGTVSKARPLPHGTFSGLRSINNYAQGDGASGYRPPFQNGGAGSSHAIPFSNGKLIDLGVPPGGEQSYGIGVNNLGQVTGFGDVPTASPVPTALLIMPFCIWMAMGSVDYRLDGTGTE